MNFFRFLLMIGIVNVICGLTMQAHQSVVVKACAQLVTARKKGTVVKKKAPAKPNKILLKAKPAKKIGKSPADTKNIQRYFDLDGQEHKQPRVTFADVAGLDGAKAELADIVDYLKNPDKYQERGVQVPHGVLLVGEPGNGKTLLARAISGQAKCDFFCVSGSAFIESYVGVGAKRIRTLFEHARRHAPCIVFIDEIDSIGGHRVSGSRASPEDTQTLNQLLTEMDGFQTNSQPVIVIAATNRVDMLDSALIRPGRFDRQVHVLHPDVGARESILRVHTRNKKIDHSVDFSTIARGTVGFSAAQLANLVNEAALGAINAGHCLVTMDDFEEARDKIMLGRQSNLCQTQEELQVTAYHESGHALTRVLLGSVVDPLHKMTIIPRGVALGVTYSLPDSDRYTVTKQYLVCEIMTLFGGRIAEELTFNTLTSGASDDFNKAAHLARKMVCAYGMSPDLGMIVYDSAQYFMYSEKTRETIDREAQKILDSAYTQTKELLIKNRVQLDALAQCLLNKKTLFACEVYALLGMPPRVDYRWMPKKSK